MPAKPLRPLLWESENGAQKQTEKWVELSHFSGKKDAEETVDDFFTDELTSQRPGHPALPSILRVNM